MAKKKAAAKKPAKKHIVRKSIPKKAPVEKVPEYMVQIHEPKMIRKDVLESLREIIIFMQGYEKFRLLQEEKVTLFAKLKRELKEIEVMIDSKLRHYLPKGKLHPVTREDQKKRDEKEVVDSMSYMEEKPVPVQVVAASPMPVGKVVPPKNELDDLESQLKDIQSQLEDLS